jgi:hypothetical protein
VHQEYQKELTKLKEGLPKKSGKSSGKALCLITQASASPKPFFTQAYTEPQHVRRNAEHFVSQQAGKSTDLPKN